MALDPVEVTRLLEAASRTQWPTQKSVREAVDARLALRELAPELAADWLRLRAIGQKIIDSAPGLSMTSDRTAPTVFTLHVSVVLEPAELALLQSLAGVSEGNPE